MFRVELKDFSTNSYFYWQAILAYSCNIIHPFSLPCPGGNKLAALEAWYLRGELGQMLVSSCVKPVWAPCILGTEHFSQSFGFSFEEIKFLELYGPFQSICELIGLSGLLLSVCFHLLLFFIIHLLLTVWLTILTKFYVDNVEIYLCSIYLVLPLMSSRPFNSSL